MRLSGLVSQRIEEDVYLEFIDEDVPLLVGWSIWVGIAISAVGRRARRAAARLTR
jgi:hypothetical protein